MNNNWRGIDEAVFTFSRVGGEEDWFCTASRLSELVTKRGGKVGRGWGGQDDTRWEAVITHGMELHSSLNSEPGGSWAAQDSAGTPLDVRPDVQAPAASSQRVDPPTVRVLPVMASVWST